MENKIILVNGPAGVGKSTLADELHKCISFSLKIDIDKIKFAISDFRTDNSQAVKLAINTALVMAEFYASEGYSVIIDRMIWGGFNSIKKLNQISENLGVKFIHIVLSADKNVVLERAQKRGFPRGDEGGLSLDKVSLFYDKIQELRPENISLNIDTTKLSPQEVLEETKRFLSLQS